ncbi:MAG: nuclear transport factor 2 family protein [Phascolarctobacterium sp.]|nr:nuclear transport factor 2 family protein [Phascolarctobacterium sp.]
MADLDAQYPNRKIEFVHLFADGDYVITHIHFMLVPDGYEAMGMDIFRFEGDKIAEHWDVIQPVPTQSANDNGMY